MSHEKTIAMFDAFVKLLVKLHDQKFTGQVIFNFSQGAIGSIEKREKVKMIDA